MNNIITPEIETEAALYAEGTKYSKADIIAEYRAHVRRAAEDGVEHLDIQRFCENVLGIDVSGSDAVERVIASLKGERLTSDRVAKAFDNIDGYYPVIDGDLVLTGEFRYADQPGDWSSYRNEAAIDNEVALAAGWTIDDEGFAEPSEFAEDGIGLPAETLCKLSGLSLEELGLDESCTVTVFPDYIGGLGGQGHDLPDLAAGNKDLEKRVWQAAVKWAKGGDK